MEAMSYGIPVVSTKTGGIPELVIEDLDLLVSPNEPVEMAKKILEIITLPYDFRVKLSRKCYSRVKEDFDVEQTAFQFKKWLDSIQT
jgi:glycosyltransferase involved in cell wall biosynthesis